MIEDDVNVRFDENSKIKILPSNVSEHLFALNKENSNFISKTADFKDAMQKVMIQVQKVSKIAEMAKLRAIGMRNKVEIEREDREIKKAELNFLLKERQTELRRHQEQHKRLLAAQSALKEKMDMFQKF